MLALCALVAAACRPAQLAPVASVPSPLAALAHPAPDMARLHVLMINGGGRPPQNYQSHLLHVRELQALLLQASAHPDQISTFNADGADPAADLAVREVQRLEQQAVCVDLVRMRDILCREVEG